MAQGAVVATDPQTVLRLLQRGKSLGLADQALFLVAAKHFSVKVRSPRICTFTFVSPSLVQCTHFFFVPLISFVSIMYFLICCFPGGLPSLCFFSPSCAIFASCIALTTKNFTEVEFPPFPVSCTDVIADPRMTCAHYHYQGDYEKALQIIDDMTAYGLKINFYTFTFAVSVAIDWHREDNVSCVYQLTRFFALANEQDPSVFSDSVCQTVMKELTGLSLAPFAAWLHVTFLGHTTCKTEVRKDRTEGKVERRGRIGKWGI